MRKITNPDADILELNLDLLKLDAWAQQWAVKFSAPKTKYMIISRKINRPDYGNLYLAENILERVQAHEHLGLIMTESMTWEKNIDNRIKKAANMINMLTRSTCLLPRSCKEEVYGQFHNPGVTSDFAV